MATTRTDLQQEEHQIEKKVEQHERKVLAKPVQVLMGEEGYATWVATCLLLSVMGTQFTSRTGVQDTVRVSLDVSTMCLSLIVLTWASLGYFDVISRKTRTWILTGVVCLMALLLLAVIVCVAQKKI